MDKAKQRFEMQEGDVTVAHRGQCAKCVKNLTYEKCKSWRIKPVQYVTDEQPCPVFVERN